MISAAHTHFTHIQAPRATSGRRQVSANLASAQVTHLNSGAGERDRTADLPFTRRLLCQLSYTGGDSLHRSRTRP